MATYLFKEFGARFLPALAYSDYRKLWAAGIFAQASNWSLIVARAALALSITGNAAAAAAILKKSASVSAVLVAWEHVTLQYLTADLGVDPSDEVSRGL